MALFVYLKGVFRKMQQRCIVFRIFHTDIRVIMYHKIKCDPNLLWLLVKIITESKFYVTSHSMILGLRTPQNFRFVFISSDTWS